MFIIDAPATMTQRARAWSWHHRKYSSPSFHPSARRQTVCRLDPMIPPAGVCVWGGEPAPFLLLPVSYCMAQVMICGSQDWLATWGRHCTMTGGPVGVWLSKQRPLTMCCRAEPLGFHFCRGNKVENINWPPLQLDIVLFPVLKSWISAQQVQVSSKYWAESHRHDWFAAITMET